MKHSSIGYVKLFNLFTFSFFYLSKFVNAIIICLL